MQDKGRGQGVVEELAWSPARGPVCYKGYFRQSWPKSTTALRNLKTPTSKVNEFPVPSMTCFMLRMRNRSRYFNSHFCWLNAIIYKTNIEQWSCKSPNRGKAPWPAIISHVKIPRKSWKSRACTTQGPVHHSGQAQHPCHCQFRDYVWLLPLVTPNSRSQTSQDRFFLSTETGNQCWWWTSPITTGGQSSQSVIQNGWTATLVRKWEWK